MHRRTDLWGPDGERFLTSSNYLAVEFIEHAIYLAHEFDPDRFLDERLRKYLTPNPFIFLPFNAGPRICLGQQVRLHPYFLCAAARLIHPSSRITRHPSSLSGSFSSFPRFHMCTKRNPPRRGRHRNGWVRRAQKARTKLGLKHTSP